MGEIEEVYGKATTSRKATKESRKRACEGDQSCRTNLYSISMQFSMLSLIYQK